MSRTGNSSDESLIINQVLDKKIFLWLLLLTLVLLTLPLFNRSLANNDNLIGSEAYFHKRIADSIIENPGIVLKGTIQDEGVYKGRKLNINFHQIAIAALGVIIGTEYASMLLPIVFGALSFFLLFKALNNLKIKRSRKNIILIILMFSTPFIYAFTKSTIYSSIIMLNILLLFLLTAKDKRLQPLALIPSILILTFGITHFTFTILGILTLVYAQMNCESNRECCNLISSKTALTLILVIAIVAILYIFSPYHSTTINSLNGIDSSMTTILKNLIVDLGGIVGMSLFNLFLIIAGMISLWDKKSKCIASYVLWVCISISGIIVDNHLFIYLFFASLMFMAYGLENLIERKWHLKLVKLLTIIVIICGLLFSALSYENRIAQEEPDIWKASAIEFLAKQEEIGNVLSSAENGYLIQELGEQPVLVDASLDTVPNVETTLAYSKKMFKEKDLKETRKMLWIYDVTYILVDKDMKREIWKDRKEGLLFLTRNNETFKNIYESPGAQIWKVDRDSLVTKKPDNPAADMQNTTIIDGAKK